MQSLIDELYDKRIIHSAEPLSQELVEKIKHQLTLGTASSRFELSKTFACYILDNRVPGFTKEQGATLLFDSLNKNNGALHVNCYNRILKLACESTQEQAVKYLKLCYSLNCYDAPKDLAYFLISGKDGYTEDSVQYRECMYQFLSDALEEDNDTKVTAILYCLLKNQRDYIGKIDEQTFKIIESAKLSENWLEKHSELLQKLIAKKFEPHDAFIVRLINELLHDNSLRANG